MRIETHICGELQENAYLVVAEDTGAAIVVDPGDEPTALVQRIRELGVELNAILLTHGHWDHVNGVRELRAAFDAPVYLHEADRFLYDHVLEQAALLGLQTDPRFHADPQPPVGHTVADGDVIELGPFRFDVLHTPGHSPGGVCYAMDDAALGRVVFVGDTIFAGSVGRCDLPGGSFEQLLDGIRRRILTLDDNVTLYPGHGPPTTVGTERHTNPFLL